MRVFSLIKYIFLFLGIVTLVITAVTYQGRNDFLDSALPAEGIVVSFQVKRSDGSTYYNPVVEFADRDGEKRSFVSSTGSNPPAYKKGESVDVLYAPHAPEEATINSFFELWGGVVISAILGTVFSSVGALMFLMARFKRKRKEQLMKIGVTVGAQLQSVERNGRFSMNGRNPYIITCQWTNPETYAIHRFESENIWFDPSEYITRETIDVYVKPGNLRVYYVDVSFLPEVAS
ncbi:DUF3592 domain-containing protein [Pseudomonas sp. NPDC090202]|uniref:DUF3592 domain-containing protein n=1 Tax=unclassified Pseudomonas TaxID=196821 RepID=UPI00381AD592